MACMAMRPTARPCCSIFWKIDLQAAALALNARRKALAGACHPVLPGNAPRQGGRVMAQLRGRGNDAGIGNRRIGRDR